MPLSNITIRWLLRGTGSFRRQLLQEMLAAHGTARGLRAQQLGALGELKLQQRRNQQDSNLVQSIPEAFKCVLPSQSTALYTTVNSAGRPHQVWRQELGQGGGTLLFEERNESCTVDVALTRDGKYATINSNTRTSSEVHLLQTDRLTDTPLLLRPREQLVEYYVDHAHGHFYIFTNLGSDMEYKVMLARDRSPREWLEFYKPKEGFVLQDLELYEHFVVLYGAKELVPVVMVMDAHDMTREPLVLYEEDACHIEKSDSTDFQSQSLSFWLSSPAHPPRLFMCEEQKLLVPDYPSGWESEYETDRHMVPGKDGSQIPLSLVYRRNLLRKDGSNPLQVLVYGCYGENLYTGYQPEKLCMLDRGWILAYCHARGGGELGRRWYYAGQGRNKQRTFEDLHACVEYLHRARYSQSRLTALHGSSAGGMAVGMFCNLWPQLVQAAILQVPFVNVIETLTNSSLYLSCKDHEEFSNPNVSEEDWKHIFSICPHSNLKPQDYPATFVWASRVDNVIPFSGVRSYVKELRKCVQRHRSINNNGNLVSSKQFHCQSRNKSSVPRGSVLFYVDRYHDHYSSDRAVHQKFGMVTMELAFLHKALDLTL